MLADAEQRLEALIVKAHEDPRTAKVDKYLSYKTPDDFSNPRREVHVSDLADFMSDKEAPMALREKARDALKSPYHRGLDPDLAISEGRSKRVVFSMNRLVPLLQSKDEVSRTMAADVLDSFWHPNDPDILRYNPRAGNEKTWVPAIAAWRRILEHR